MQGDCGGVEILLGNFIFRFGHLSVLTGMMAALAVGCGKDAGEAGTKGAAGEGARVSGGVPGVKSADLPSAVDSEGPKEAGGAASFDGNQLIFECEASSFDTDKRSQEIFVAWFHADWCPSCEKQRRELEPFSRDSIKGRPVICRYDYDETEDLQGKLRVQRQSSFIRYVKGIEQARSVGETGTDRLIKFLEG